MLPKDGSAPSHLPLSSPSSILHPLLSIFYSPFSRLVLGGAVRSFARSWPIPAVHRQIILHDPPHQRVGYYPHRTLTRQTGSLPFFILLALFLALPAAAQTQPKSFLKPPPVPEKSVYQSLTSSPTRSVIWPSVLSVIGSSARAWPGCGSSTARPSAPSAAHHRGTVVAPPWPRRLNVGRTDPGSRPIHGVGERRFQSSGIPARCMAAAAGKRSGLPSVEAAMWPFLKPNCDGNFSSVIEPLCALWNRQFRRPELGCADS